MARIIWSLPALDQLSSIADFIALDNRAAAIALVQRVFDSTDRIQSFTRLGRRVPELKHSPFRQVWLQPCWIYYRIEGETIYIVHVRGLAKRVSG